MFIRPGLCLLSPELALGRFGSLPCQQLLSLGGGKVHVPQAAPREVDPEEDHLQCQGKGFRTFRIGQTLAKPWLCDGFARGSEDSDAGWGPVSRGGGPPPLAADSRTL